MGSGLDELGAKVSEGVSRLRGLDVGDQLEVEILSRLARGRRTIAELVEQVYGLGRYDEGFGPSYTRVRRKMKRLESKGLVSTKLFGKERPYRLTDLAVTNLARIGGEGKQIDLLSMTDLAVYVATGTLALPMISLSAHLVEMASPTVVMVFAGFFYLLGGSTFCIIRMIRRVL